MSDTTKRKLTRKEKREIEAVIRKAKGDRKPHTAQGSIPFEVMYPDGICKLNEKSYSKCIEFEDVNYQLANADDKTAVFENLCDFYNYYDASIGIQLSLISRYANKEDFQKTISIPPQGDDFDSIRLEYTGMLQRQLARGNNGLIKTKFLTLTIEADNIQAARSRLGRIEADTLNQFKVMGAAARVLDGRQRLSVIHGIFHPDGERFNFDWKWLPESGLSAKDYIAPSSFHFGGSRMFRMGRKLGAVSFLQILAPELNDRMLADFMEAEGGIMVNLHIRSIDQNDAIKTIKRKITDLDAMKIAEQKKAVRSGYDMDIIPSDLATYGGEAKNLLHELQSRNERMFLLTFIVLNFGDTKRKLDNAVFQASGVAQKYNCTLTRLDFQQEAGLMSSLPMGVFTIGEVQGDLAMLFEKQYILTLAEIVEVRYRTETDTWTDDKGNTHTDTYQVAYNYYILNVELENFNLSHVPVYIMGEDALSLYAMYMSTLGNRPDLFSGGAYPNASTLKEPTYYDIPAEALADETFAALIAEAEKYIGYPYVWGGSSPATSFDCSGFVSYVLTNSGLCNTGRLGAQGLYNISTPVTSANAKPGDLIFFVGTYDTPGVSHVGIYVGNGMMLHCGDPISYANINTNYWQNHFYAFGRPPY